MKSSSEIDTVSKRATKASGFSWGIAEEVGKNIKTLELFGIGYSWGGFESLALQQEFRELGNRNFLRLPKDEHLVRLHIGLEDPKDLIQDLKRSLKLVK